MNVEIVKSEKNLIELKVDNLTVAEVLRVYLNEVGADFAAWRREHPSKPVIFRIQGEKNPKKLVSDAIEAIKKDLDKIASAVKK